MRITVPKDHKFQERSNWIVTKVVYPILYVLALWGSAIAFAIRQEGSYFAHAARLGAGYSPASNMTSNLTQTQVNYYDKNFVDNLKAETPQYRCVERRPLPENSGNTLNLFEYVTFGPDLSQAPEGTVQSGETINILTDKIVIGNYADYLNYSRFSMQLAIDPALENGGKELAYQAALTVAYLIKNTTDVLNTIDASVLIQNAATVPFNKNNITSAVASLRGRNVKPMEAGEFCGIIPPFAWGDALNDPANNSFTDVLKRTQEGTDALKELPSGDGGRVQVMHWAGVAFYESTIVLQTLNYKGNTGVTAYRTYIYGKDGIIAISMGAKENTALGDGDWRNLKVITKRYDDASVSDPAMMIGGSCAYNFNFAVGVVPDTTGRVRVIDAPTQIS
jgi:N4-gp56 family major capsid protein